MKKIGWFIVSLLFVNQLFAQQKVELDTVVIASKTKENIKSIGKVVYKIDSTDLVKFAGQSVAQALSTVPGVEINNAQGNFGSNLSYYMRGGRNKDVLIMIDGVPVGDPSQINFYYDLNLLPLDQVQSIEVIKGGNSALYGSNASAGVININLKKNINKKIAGNFGSSVGSFGTHQHNGQLSGKMDKFTYNILGSYFKTDGISAAFGNNFENDGGERRNWMTEIGFNASENINLKGFVQLNDENYDYDNFSSDQPTNYAETKEVSYGLKTEIKNLKNGLLTVNSKISEFKRVLNDAYGFKTNARNYFISLNESYEANKYLKLIVGAEFNTQNQSILGLTNQLIKSSDDSEFNTFNPYAGAVITLGDFKLIGNGRLNTHSNYDNQFVYAITPSYLFKFNEDFSISAKGSISTAYITPTLFQLYGNASYAIPSTNLSPAESITYEGGFSFYFKDKLTLNSTYFYRKDKNTILDKYNPPFYFLEYYNSNQEFNIKGVEIDIKYSPNKNLILGSAYTYTYLDKDLLALSAQTKIPMNKVSSYITLKDLLLKNNSISVMHTYVGRREDGFGTFVNLNPYNLLSASVSQKVGEYLNFNFSINNILDHDYFETIGYSTKGRNFTLGISSSF